MVGTKVEIVHALHEILLDAAAGGDDAVYHLVLDQVADDLAHAAGDHVGGVPQENGGAGCRAVGG
jgi:hypothetical protein